MRVLLLCNYDPYNAATVVEHVNAIVRYSKHDVFVYNELLINNGDIKFKGHEISVKLKQTKRETETETEIETEIEKIKFGSSKDGVHFKFHRSTVDPCLNDFDAIIIHYSIFIAVEQYLSVKSRYKIAGFQGVKIAFLQDEYRFIDRSINAMHELGLDVVFTCVPDHSIEAVYPKERMNGIRVVNTLTGYPSDFLSVLEPKPLRKRTYHVCYRGRRYPDWHGRMGKEKFEIGKNFQIHAKRYRLRTNISSREQDRVYGADWVNLIQNSRAVLGVESGASVFDFKGDISTRTETVRALLGKKGIGYDELRQRFFAESEDQIDLAQISPRVFEAICLRTMCILYEGNYSGILIPDVHYLALKKDFSNIDYVCKRLRDDVFVSEVVANAYAEIAQGQIHTWRNFVRTLDHEMELSRKNKLCFTSAVDIQKQGNRHMDARSYREFYDELHPFHMILYPHAFSAPSSSVAKLLRSLADRMPSGVKSKFKFLMHR